MAIPGFNRGNAPASSDNDISSWKGVKAQQGRVPDLDEGSYTLSFVGRDQNDFGLRFFNFKTEDGRRAQCRAPVSSPESKAMTQKTVLALSMALVGAESEDEYFGFDPKCDLLEWLMNGKDSDFVQNLRLVGRKVAADITLGSERVDKEGKPTGTHFRDFTFLGVDEDEQTVPLMDGLPDEEGA